MTSINDRPAPAECAMCRKRLTALETVTVSHEARMLELAEEYQASRQDIANLRQEFRDDLAEMRRAGFPSFVRNVKDAEPARLSMSQLLDTSVGLSLSQMISKSLAAKLGIGLSRVTL